MNNKCDEQTRRAMKRNICRKTKHDWGVLLYLGEGVKEGVWADGSETKTRGVPSVSCVPASLRLPPPSCHCPSAPVLLPLGGVSAWLCGFSRISASLCSSASFSAETRLCPAHIGTGAPHNWFSAQGDLSPWLSWIWGQAEQKCHRQESWHLRNPAGFS